MAAIRLLLRLFRWAILFAVALALSAVGHLNTETGRRAGRVIANVLISDLIAGRLDIGRIDRLFPDRIVVHDVSLYDPRGTRVIHGDEIVLVLDVGAAIDGTLRFSHAELHRGVLRLEEREAGLTFLEALGAQEPSTGPSIGPPFHAIVDDMHLDRVVAYGSMLGASNLHARDVRAHMRMEFEEETDIRVFSGTGLIDGPMDFVATLDDATARVNTAPHVGSTVDARVHYQDQKARAHLRYAVPANLPDDAPNELDLILEVDPIDLATVQRIGFDWAAPFQGRGSGFVRIHGPTDQLALDASIQHEGGPLVLRGQLPSEGDVVIEASTTGLDLARLVPDSPSLPIGGRVRLEIHPEESGRPSTVHGDLEAFVFDGYAVPTLTVDATLLEDRVTLDTIDAPYGGTGRLHGSGYATYEGDVHVEVAGSLGDIARDPNVQRHASGARGRAQIRATVDRHDGELDVSARGTVREAGISEVAANEVHFDFDSHTNTNGTRIHLDSSMLDLRVGPVMLGDGNAVVRSAGNSYAFEGTFEDPRVAGRTAITGSIATVGDTSILRAPTIRYARRGVSVEATANRIEFTPDRQMLAEGAVLQIDGSVAARMNARWSAHGSDTAQLVIDGIPLDTISRLFAPHLPELNGIVRGTAAISGDLESSPTVEIHASIENGAVRGLEDLEGSFELGLDRDTLTGRLELDAGDAGEVDVTIEGHAPITLPRLGDAIREGEYNFRAAIQSLDLARVLSGLVGTNESGVRGCIDGDLTVGGYLAFAPTLDANLSIGNLAFGDSPPLEVAMISRYDGQNLEATASIGADHGDGDTRDATGRCSEHATAHLADSETFAEEGLAELYGNIQIPLLELFAGTDALVSELQVVPWGFSARMPPRRLGSLPESLRRFVPTALTDFDAAGSFTALGGFGSVQASLAATLDYAGDTNRFVCGRGTRPRLSIWATHANGDTRGRVEAFVGAERVASAVARTSLPLEEWLLGGAIGALPPVSLEAAITPDELQSLGNQAPSPVESSDIPYLCEYFVGPFGGRMRAADVFTDHPTMSGAVTSESLQFRRLERSIRGTIRNAIDETPVIPEIALKFEGDSSRLEFNHDMTWWGDHNVSQLAGFVDWTWNTTEWIPLVADDAAFDLTLDAPSATVGSNARMPTQVPLQVLAGWIPLFGRVDGRMETRLHAFGTLAAPEIEGRARISDGTLVLESIGQRLRNVSGVLELADGTARLRNFTARDEDGTAAFDGTIEFEGWSPTRFDLDAAAMMFPVRDEGSIIARMTGHADVVGTFGEDRLEANVDIGDLAIMLTPPSSQNPIPLGEHPDVRIVGLAAAPEEFEEPYPLRVRIARTPRFWVRSEDFSAQVSTELGIRYEDPDVRIVGDLELHRGFFEVFGKRFEVEQGSMVFDGGPTIDPLVSLVAVHQLRGGGRNDIVTVRAGGTLSAPTVEFSSPLVTSGDQGQILCVLITGSASSSGQCGESSNVSSTENAAGTQAAQFLSGIAFGVATLALRQQFGDLMPVIAIEGGSGSNLSPRVRAGLNLERYIPERLRRVVRGIYVEGYVARQSSASPQAGAAPPSATTAAQYGVSLELQFPHNIVTQGEYAQGNAWRLGVTWEP